jgi:hypothetical protein
MEQVVLCSFSYFLPLVPTYAGACSPPKLAPRYADKGRMNTICSDFPVSLLSLLGAVDHVAVATS